jgi:thiol:disulfide interchange protein
MACAAWAQPPTPVVFEAAVDRAYAHPGSLVRVAATFRHEDGWHIYTHTPVMPPELEDLMPIATQVRVEPPEGFTLEGIQWPKPKTLEVPLLGEGVKYEVYAGVATAYVTLRVGEGVTGTFDIPVSGSFQACSDVCLMPEDVERTVRVTVLPAGEPLPEPDAKIAAIFAGFDPARVIAFAAPSVPGSGAAPGGPAEDGAVFFSVLGWNFSLDTGGPLGFSLLVLAALAGGFILNLTPCVLPVIPLKIIALSNSAGNPGRALLLGVVMCLGIIAFWLAIGGAIALSTSFKSASTIIANWWFAVGIGVFMIVMGVGMFGAFSVGLPSWVYSLDPKHDSVPGSFLFGILTAVLATPCAAPFAGTAMGWAAFQPGGITMIVFAAIGVGMALPYFVLSVNPSWVKRVPRAGPASELLKQFLGLLMFSVAAFFVGSGLLSLHSTHPYMGEVFHWWFVGVLAALAGGWLILRTFQLTRSPIRRGTFGVMGLAFIVLPLMWAQSQTVSAKSTWVPAGEAVGVGHGPWKPYSRAAFEEAKAAGKVVVLNFTAVWCLNCKTLEAAVLSTAAIREALEAPDVVAMTVDLTARKGPDGEVPEGWQALYELREAGPPVLAIWGPGTSRQFQSNAYTVQVVLDEIQRARGG